jgi:gliding motility-associated-like protein
LRNILIKNIITSIFILIGSFLFSQEICDNGIDDDADGLIDLQDFLECSCSLSPDSISVPSLIPNPSFENRSCCPTASSQLNCADTWMQGSFATTDYFNTCGITSYVGTPANPLPDGDGYLGYFDATLSSGLPYKEYAGACLLDTMFMGVNYQIQFYISKGAGTSNASIAIFGSNSCTNLPIGGTYFGCPSLASSLWQPLDSVVAVLNPTGWTLVTLNFTPTQNITAITIGGTCHLEPPSTTNYYYIDNIILNTTTSFNTSPAIGIDSTGSYCDNNLLLTSQYDSLPNSFQWYKDSIAIVGETNSTYNVSLGGEGNYQVRLTYNSGCMISTTHSVFSSEIITVINQSICAGGSFNFEGNTLTAVGTYYDTIQTIGNCDSIITLNLSVNSIIRDTITASICAGQTFVFGGNNYTVSGFFSDTLSSASGCDSISTLNLSIINGVIRDTINVSICAGQTYVFGSKNYAVSGFFSDTLSSVLNCDSISTLNLLVNSTLRDTINVSICNGQSYVFGSKSYNTSGLFNDTINSVSGCDSISYLNLYTTPQKRDTLIGVICDEDSVLFGNDFYKVAGVYRDTFSLINGCDSISTLMLTVNFKPSPSIFGDTIFCNNSTSLLSTEGVFVNYLWSSGETSSSISIFNGGKYSVTVQNNELCKGVDSIYVSKINCEDTCEIFIPNSFSPNSDGINDVFFVQSPSLCEILSYNLRIFNRWGELIFETQLINNSWDGTYKGLPSQIGIYSWVLEYQKKGEILISRKIGHLNIVK